MSVPPLKAYGRAPLMRMDSDRSIKTITITFGCGDTRGRDARVAISTSSFDGISGPWATGAAVFFLFGSITLLLGLGGRARGNRLTTATRGGPWAAARDGGAAGLPAPAPPRPVP